MHYTNSFVASAAILALSHFASALPTESPDTFGGATFKVHQVANPNHVRNGALAYAKALRKYGATVSDELHAAAVRASNITGLARRQQEGTDTATPEGPYDAEYLSPVSIGSPAQTLHLDFDTGSADLWVFSSQTTQRRGQAIYSPSSSSSSSQLNGATWSISYGDGSGASGNVFADRVAVGAVTVTRQAVEAATSVSATFAGDASSSGLLGLAFPSINQVRPTRQETFFANAQSSLNQSLFTTRLRYHEAGNYNFGYIDGSEYSGSLYYTSIDNSNGFWEFTGSGYQVGTHAFVDNSITAVADTGTSLLLIVQSAVDDYYAGIPGAVNNAFEGGYTFPCSTTLPSFTVGIGSYRATIPGQYINYAPVTPGSSTCFGGIQSSANAPFAIYGDVFLKSQFVLWDGGDLRLGFAQQEGVSSTKSNGDSNESSGFGLGSIFPGLGALFGGF